MQGGGTRLKFTESQRSAIEYGGENLQLVACAGSGKTEVVARRVVRLLRPDGGKLEPRNIIAFTFTDKAAAELKERLIRRVRDPLRTSCMRRICRRSR
jgi:DNA helicase II / ATP-dependent DNA helicase PcrA